MGAYYNEFAPYPAQWLRNLIAAGHLADGDVDERDIREVKGDDLKSYDQCHFFAGIGGWPLALRLAGWPDDRPVWTGSCPCQPLSGAGQRKGHADERHIWPAFQSLIAERHPATVLGEQVASKDGREWLCGVRADLEHLGYAVGAADLPAAGVGAPHIRQRLWWVADAQRHAAEPGRAPDRSGEGAGAAETGAHAQSGRCGLPGGLGNARSPQSGRLSNSGGQAMAPAWCTSQDGFWSAHDPVPCADGKARRVEPGTFPLAHGVPARVGKLRAYGNAIVPQVAAEFVTACMEVGVH